MGRKRWLSAPEFENGLVCLPARIRNGFSCVDGRVERFATYMTGEMYALLREHSMIGRPATEPGDPAGFEMGLDAAERNGGETGGERVGLLHLLFGARAAVVSGRMAPSLLGPYISGLLTGDEMNGALNQFSRPASVTIVADSPRADLYVHALNRCGSERCKISARCADRRAGLDCAAPCNSLIGGPARPMHRQASLRIAAGGPQRLIAPIETALTPPVRNGPCIQSPKASSPRTPTSTSRIPLVKPTGFREYDARWLFEKEINLMGVQALGHGPRRRWSTRWGCARSS